MYALRLLEPPQRPAKVKGVHTSFPVFMRLAYVWAIVAASLGIWAASVENSGGNLGRFASCSDRRLPGHYGVLHWTSGVLPAFSGMRLLFSHQTDVCGPAPSHCWMSCARQLRNSCLSGLRSFRVVMASTFRSNRDGRSYGFCGELARHIRWTPIVDAANVP